MIKNIWFFKNVLKINYLDINILKINYLDINYLEVNDLKINHLKNKPLHIPAVATVSHCLNACQNIIQTITKIKSLIHHKSISATVIGKIAIVPHQN